MAATTVTASPISSFNFPSNYAYTASGYDGLLLHAISPRLAEAVYPWIATPAAAKVVTVSLFVGGGFSSLPIISKRFPVEWALGSFAIHVPFLHAAMLIDLRELRLLFRQFEMWYMLATLGEWAQCLHKSLSLYFLLLSSPRWLSLAA